MRHQGPLLLDSITDAGSQAVGRVLVSGSHGGLYPACLASRAGARAVIFNDAGRGLEDAGVAGVMTLDSVGLAAAAASHDSCRIGDAADTFARGSISTVNTLAGTCGVAPGMPVSRASELLTGAPGRTDTMAAITEARTVTALQHMIADLVLVDSASLVGDEDTGRIVITGSHGGLIGNDPARALKAAAALGVFNDAGYACDGAGTSRLPALDERRIAALTVSHRSARIGEAQSAWATGIISCANRTAVDIGLQIGEPLAAAIQRVWARIRR